MPSTKPKLAPLQTPTTATFPSELSALSARTPLSAYPMSGFPLDYIKQEDLKTPITPPLAYTDFLRTVGSPANAGDKSSGRNTPTSAPSTGSSEHSDCSCHCDTHKSPKSPTSAVQPSPFVYPSSARSANWLGRLRIPESPSFPCSESPMSAPLSAPSIRSPYSARSTRSARSPYDWDLALKGRYFDVKPPRTSKTIHREVREVVTRTVTYTPRMSPAPKGKRRKIE